MFEHRTIMRSALLLGVLVVGVTGVERRVYGQVTWAHGPDTAGIRIWDPDRALSIPLGGDPVSDVDAHGWSHLTGDACLTAPTVDGEIYEARVEFFREFTVGPLPVEIQGESSNIDYELKIAVGGGNYGEPDAAAWAGGTIREVSPNPMTLFPTTIFDVGCVNGNGWEVFAPLEEPYHVLCDWVLSPGVQYEFVTFLEMKVNHPTNIAGTCVATYEFGGISGYEGVSARLSTIVVPEPSTIIMLAMGALGLLAYGWRRQRR